MDREAKGLALRPGDGLIVVDVQNDLLPGGAVAVPEGEQIIPVINEYLRRFVRRGLPVFAIRDWHPSDHCSFKEAGGPWPAHCIVDTAGARFPPALALPQYTRVISKAVVPEPDAISCFSSTDLAQRLRHAGVRRVFVGGLALDACIFNTVKEALKRGLTTVLLVDAVRIIDIRAEELAATIGEMQRLGALPIQLRELAA